MVTTQVSTELARILVVDDESLAAQTVAKCLNSAGYKDVHFLNDSRKAIAVIDELSPDLILLELLTPHDNGGVELLEQIINNPRNRDVSVLVVSAADKGQKYKSIRMGAKGFIDKPVSPEDLLESIKKALRVV